MLISCLIELTTWFSACWRVAEIMKGRSPSFPNSLRWQFSRPSFYTNYLCCCLHFLWCFFKLSCINLWFSLSSVIILGHSDILQSGIKKQFFHCQKPSMVSHAHPCVGSE